MAAGSSSFSRNRESSGGLLGCSNWVLWEVPVDFFSSPKGILQLLGLSGRAFDSLANKIFLAYKVRLFLGYIGVAEFENDISFVQLALVFKIFLKCVFRICESIHNDTNWITVLLVHEYFNKTTFIMLFRLLIGNQTVSNKCTTFI